MSGHLNPRHSGRHSARAATAKASRNVAEVPEKVAVTASPLGATTGAAVQSGGCHAR